MGKYRYYAVVKGRATGLFDSWPACAAAVQDFPSPRYKGFRDRQDAEDWLLDERAKLEEARQARRKKRGGKDTDASGWQFVPATEPLQGPVVPEWKQRETNAGGTDQAARKC